MGERLCNFLASFLFVALVHALIPGLVHPAHAACGADGQSACTTAAASKSSTKPFCPSGTFPDPRNGGECWSCPGGYTRSAAAVTASNACYIPAGEKLSSASRHQKTPWAWDCKGGRFWDGYQGGYCWSCPGGYNRTGNHIKGGNACSASVPEKRSTATYRSKIGCPGGTVFDPRNNGECWSCPSGYNRNANAVTSGAACTAQSACNSGLKLISGKCVSTDASGRPKTCGHLNQRPCTVTEFLPSCDKGLTELGGKGKCITDTIVKDAMAGAAKLAADAARKFDEGVNGATRAAAKLAANNAVKKFNPFLRDLKKRMDGFGANEKAALDRIVKTIRSGKVDRQAQQDMRMIGAKLGLLAGQAGAIVPDNVKHSSFGVFFQDSAAAVVGAAAGYSMIMNTAPDPGTFPIGLLSTVGGSLGAQIGAGVQLGIFWQPGDISAADGAQVGVGVEAAAGPGAAVAVQWSVAGGMENKPNAWTQAIPGFQLAFAPGAKFALAASGGWSTLLGPWNTGPAAGPPVSGSAPPPHGGSNAAAAASSSQMIFGIEPNGNLFLYELNPAQNWRRQSVQIGNGWTARFGNRIFAGGPGEFYGIEANGDLIYLRYDLQKNAWSIGGKKIGSGWGGFKKVISGGNGDIYAIENGGVLKFYHHDTNFNFTIGGRNIGTEWQKPVHVIAGGNGKLYVVRQNGDLQVFRHDANFNWVVANKKIGNGWGGFSTIVASSNGTLMGVKSDGELLYYRHDGDDHFTVSGKVIGSNWTQRFGKLIFAGVN